MKNIGIIGGFWSTNIGNSFFNIGAEYILNQVFPDDNIIMISDQPAYWTFWNKKKGNPKKALNFIGSCNLDYLVILGPVFTETFDKLWKKNLKELEEKGTKVIILSAGQMKYNEAVKEKCRRVLQKYPPYILTSRDRPTYDNFHDLAENSYDGIDAAFFIPDMYKPISTDFGKYITLNFDKLPEPSFLECDKQSSCIKLGNKNYKLKFPRLSKWLASKTDAYAYIRSLFSSSNLPNNVNNYKIIRPDHRFNPMFMRKVYKGNNSFVSDIPQTYFNIYAHTELTLTDRVHACVATLIYGNKAMLFKKTGRSGLLDRVGATEIQNKPVKLDLEKVEKEKNNLISYLKNIIKSDQ